MKNLNWFEARDLAKLQRRAIRRESWNHWILYRFKVWLASEINADSSQEVLRVVTAYDFRAAEFQAKDWTEEPWEGATTPPCTTVPPAEELVQANAGLRTWTTQPALCGGNGQGGNVMPDGFGTNEEPPTISDPSEIFVYYIIPLKLSTGDGSEVRIPLLPDAGGCWVTAPATCDLAIIYGYKPDEITFDTGGAHYSFGRTVGIYVSPSNEDLSAAQHAPFVPGQPFGYIGSATPWNFPNRPVGHINILGFAAPWDGVIYKNFAYMPGATISARLDEAAEYLFLGRVHLLTYTFPPLCGTGIPVGAP